MKFSSYIVAVGTLLYHEMMQSILKEAFTQLQTSCAYVNAIQLGKHKGLDFRTSNCVACWNYEFTHCFLPSRYGFDVFRSREVQENAYLETEVVGSVLHYDSSCGGCRERTTTRSSVLFFLITTGLLHNPLAKKWFRSPRGTFPILGGNFDKRKISERESYKGTKGYQAFRVLK